jgi:hypothetical protein
MGEDELERLIDDIEWDMREIEAQINDDSRRPEGNNPQAQDEYRDWRSRATRALRGKRGERACVREELARKRGEEPVTVEHETPWKPLGEMTAADMDTEISDLRRQIQDIQRQLGEGKRWAKRAQGALDQRVRRLNKLKGMRRQLQVETEQAKPRQTADLFERIVREVVLPLAGELTPEQEELVREARERFGIEEDKG